MLGAGGDMTGGLLLGQEQTGGLDDVLSAHLGPGQVGGVALGEHGDGLAIDHDVAALGGDGALELAVHGIELQHIRQIIGGAEIIDAHDLDVGVIHAAAHDHTTDTAKPIDTDFNTHKTSSSLMEYPKCMVCLELYALPQQNASLFSKLFNFHGNLTNCLYFYVSSGMMWLHRGQLARLAAAKGWHADRGRRRRHGGTDPAGEAAV